MILPVLNETPPSSPPRSPSHSPRSARKSSTTGSVKVVIFCAVYAALAARTTSLLHILILRNSNTFGTPEPNLEHQYEVSVLQLDPTDTAKQLRHNRADPQRQHGRGAISSHGNQGSNPKGVAWLMSFPNSGTTYTLDAVRELCNVTTATNYGLESVKKDEESVPAFPNIKHPEEGPFVGPMPDRVFNTPDLFLTKTHCGGYCSFCTKQEMLIETPRSFMQSCLKGTRGVLTENQMTTIKVRYSPDLVKKAVHIFRNPLDNIVARFHLDVKQRARENPHWLDYPINQQGFNFWCDKLNMNSSRAKLFSSRWFDSSLKEAMRDVPCVTEFYRYVQWHNLAFATTSELEVPSFVFHYEDYSTRFEQVTNELTDFLGLTQVGEAPEFIGNKTYGSYYTPQQKHAIAVFVKEFASKPTWDNVHHYLDAFLTKPTDKDSLDTK